MTSKSDRAGALEAVERILNRGGEPDDVRAAVVAVLHERLGYPVELGDVRVPQLAQASGDEAFAWRVATLISPYQGT